MGQNNKDEQSVQKTDLTGKAEQSEAAIEQTERERHNKGAKDLTPEAHEEKKELKEAPESLKNSR